MESRTALPTRTKRPQVEGDSITRAQRIRIKNRRKRYLDLHPEYFQEPHLELAGRSPFQVSPYLLSTTNPPDPLLYDRLIRRFQTPSEREKQGRERGYSGILEANLVRSEAKLEAIEHPDPNSPLIYTHAPDGSITGVEQDEADRATDRADGEEKWREVVELRFLRGEDRDFDYEVVDGSEEFDDREGEDRESLEEYLNGEEVEFLGEGRPGGETGVQDF